MPHWLGGTNTFPNDIKLEVEDQLMRDLDSPEEEANNAFKKVAGRLCDDGIDKQSFRK